MTWRCSNCGEPLGETLSTGEMKLKLTKAKSYIVGYPITTSCVKCRELNKITSGEEVYDCFLPSTEIDNMVGCSEQQITSQERADELIAEAEEEKETAELIDNLTNTSDNVCKTAPITQTSDRVYDAEKGEFIEDFC